jgi:hypothetical protein
VSGSPSASGSSFGSGFSGQPGGGNCNFEFETVLASPNPDQVPWLDIGEELVVGLQESPPAVEVARVSGEFVGAVTQSAADLRSCMQGGFAYRARVLTISGGVVRVLIHPAGV